MSMLDDHSGVAGILSVQLLISSAQSLKDKRMVLRSIKDRIKSKYNVSVAELDGQDKWQTAVLGCAVIGNDQKHLNSCLQDILNFIETCRDVEIVDQRMEFL